MWKMRKGTDMRDIREEVKAYYSEASLQNEGQLKSGACCCGPGSYPAYMKQAMADIPEEISMRSYGCGSPLPQVLDGCTVLDLGCGTGQDVYLASALVGERGSVIGIDMNPDQLGFARKYQAEMVQKYGYDNVTFLDGYLEDLKAAGIQDESIDVVISNCVINLSPYKDKVFAEIFRVLKPGGELYFSDVFADRRVPEDIRYDPVLVGECLGGALYLEDFRRMMRKAGWEDIRYMSKCSISIDNPEIEEKTGDITFYSCTVRAMKLPDYQEDRCEQYGQVVTYRGGIRGSENYFDLDEGHRFYKGLPTAVCGNTCAMIEHTRLGQFFDVTGDRSVHYGLFECCGSGEKDESSCCC